MDGKKLLIVGGVAGGMSCAARARRLSENLEIIVFERGPYISFANCGLPYHIGGDIADRQKLILRTPEQIKETFNIDVRVKQEVLRIDRDKKTVFVKDLEKNEEYSISYDGLVLSPGAAPLRPPIPGIDRAGHFTLRNVPDTDAILAWMEKVEGKNAVVVGGGYIGLEMAEQLRERGLEVRLIELLPQVMAPLDPEMAAWLHEEMVKQGIKLHLGAKVVAFEDPEAGKASTVVLDTGECFDADVVILGLGVRAETKLAADAGLTIGERGGIAVNRRLQTSDPDIYAIGDAAEVDFVPLNEKAMVPLAGPANRQGRMAADIFMGLGGEFAGVIGTAVLRLFGLTAACVGANEKQLKRAKKPYEAIHLHPGNHVGYYPGATPIALKVLFDPETGRLYGAQAVGQKGVDKRIDVIATAIKFGGTVEDLAQLELCYAPPYGAAKDPVNLAGMMGENIRRGLTYVAQWDEVPKDGFSPEDERIVVDVREAKERAQVAVPNSLHIPLGELRGRLSEIPRDKKVIVHCASGQRSNNALRILLQHGFEARNLTGSMRTWGIACKGF